MWRLTPAPVTPFWISRASAALAGALGSVVLLGWMTGTPFLFGVIYPGWPAMPPLTAVTFLTAGAALWLLTVPPGEIRGTSGRERLGRLLAVAVCAIGAMRVSAVITGVGPVGLLWFAPPAEVVFLASPSPAMAALSAMGFLLDGIALLLVARPRFTRALPLLALLAGCLASAALGPFFFGGSSLLPFASMSVLTALGLVLLSTGILSARPDGGLVALLIAPSNGGKMLRRLLPAIAGISILFSILRLEALRSNWVGPEAGLTLFAIMNVVLMGAITWTVALTLDRIDRQRQETLEVLRQSEARHARVVASTQDAIWEWDLLNHSVYRSPRWLEMRGLEAHEVSAREDEWVSRIHPEDVERVLASWRAHLAGTSDLFVEEYRTRCRDGSWKWVLNRGKAEFDEAGNAVRMSGTESDITQRIQADVDLRENEQHYRLLFDSSPYCIHEIDREGRLLTMNRAGLKMMGVQEMSAVFGMPYLSVVAEEDQVRIGRLMQLAFAGQAAEFDFKTNNDRTFQASFVPITDATGTVVRLMGLTQDVTERHRSESALRTAQERLEETLAASNTGLWEWNTETNEVFFSREWKQQLGYEDDEIPNLFSEWESRLHPDDRQRALNYAQAYANNPAGAFEMEFRMRHRDDSWRWIAAHATFATERDGRRVRLLGSHVDTTERKRTEGERSNLEAQLHQAQKLDLVGTLASGVAHDFNNILGAIIGSVDLALKDIEPSHPAAGCLNRVLRSSHRAAGLVEQLLAISRPSTLVRQVVHLPTALREDSQLLRAMIPSGVDFVVEFGSDPPNIEAHPTDVHQVLLNLVTNAWHSLEGRSGRVSLVLDGVTVGADIEPPAVGLFPGRYARVRVTDTGTGMDAATVARIFDPFFTTKEVGRGTGLGLSVVQRIVRGLGGVIAVESDPGRGTTFVVYIPGVAAPAIDPAEAASAPKGHGQHVLFVDDEPELVSLGTEILERHGYQVTGETRAAAAVAAVRADPEKFDLLVADYNMPGASGVDLALDAWSVCPGLPVLIASGFVSDDLLTRAAASGIHQVLRKPYSMETLCAAVASALERAQGPSNR